MGTKYSLLRADYWIQTIFGVGVIVCFVSFVGIIYGMLLAAPFGTWQVISGLIFGVGYRDKRRLFYLGCVVLYFVLWDFIDNPTNQYGIRDSGFSLLIIFAIVLAFWYYAMTYKDFKNFNHKVYLDETNEDILDA